jgi:hypothetical protein
MLETESKKCGNCYNFDVKDCHGLLIGNTNLKTGFVRNGLCRGPRGLVLGILNEQSDCKQPYGVFQQK